MIPIVKIRKFNGNCPRTVKNTVNFVKVENVGKNNFLVKTDGQCGSLGGSVHAGHVHVGTEHADLVVDASVRLHALEQLNRVVENLTNIYIIIDS